ncbi:MAG TPA: hypothetical protein VJ847_03505 [Gemmatimonadales bacterium]|jgi:hypothetical protein|nr:hypothetical protein [Gemmatimonadales bacterium]
MTRSSDRRAPASARALRFVLPPALALALLPAGLAAQQGPHPCPHGAADDEATLVSVVIPGSGVPLRRAVDSVLARLHYRVSAGESSLDQWVTEAKFGWPEGSELAGKADAPDPGVQVIVDLSPDSAGTMVRVAASAVCLTGTMAESRRPGSPELAIETVSAVQVASEIRRQAAQQGGQDEAAGAH